MALPNCEIRGYCVMLTFPVHRVVLAAASPYFQVMFTGGFKESGQDTIHLKGASQKGLSKVLDSIHSSDQTNRRRFGECFISGNFARDERYC